MLRASGSRGNVMECESEDSDSSIDIHDFEDCEYYTPRLGSLSLQFQAAWYCGYSTAATQGRLSQGLGTCTTRRRSGGVLKTTTRRRSGGVLDTSLVVVLVGCYCNLRNQSDPVISPVFNSSSLPPSA